MNTICIISVYFGSFPKYFELWLRTCNNNRHIDFRVYTDVDFDKELPYNVSVIHTTLDEVRYRASRVTGADVNLYNSYKCCDLKPLFGLIFQEDIRNYKYWGECDLDLLFGDIYSFMTYYCYEKYDKFLPLGHLSIYRNTVKVNNYYKLSGDTCGGWRYVLTTNQNFAFDEIPGIVSIYLNNKFPFFYKRVFADISPVHKRFTLSKHCGVDGHYVDNYRYQIFYWKEGKVFRDYFIGNQLVTDEFIYIHFRSRPNFSINEDVLNANAFYITRFGFIPKLGQTTKDIIRKYNPCPLWIVERIEDCYSFIRYQSLRLREWVKRSLPSNIWVF